MKKIIKKVEKEKALQGFVLSLENGGKIFLSNVQLNGIIPVEEDVLELTAELSPDKKNLKEIKLNGKQLSVDENYPFPTYEESLLYAYLPPLLRHQVALIKLQNPKSQEIPVPYVTYFAASGWKLYNFCEKQMSLTEFKKLSAAEKQAKLQLKNPVPGRDNRLIFNMAEFYAESIFADREILEAKEPGWLYKSKVMDMFKYYNIECNLSQYYKLLHA